MILAATESIAGIFSPARGRGCLAQFKDKWLQVQVCASHLYFSIILMLRGTTADHRTCYIKVLIPWSCRWSVSQWNQSENVESAIYLALFGDLRLSF